jgi:hypothetical protein
MTLTTEQKQELLVIQKRLGELANASDLFDARILLNMASSLTWVVAKEDTESMHELVTHLPAATRKVME